MSDVVASHLGLEHFFEKNSHFTDKKWLCDFRAQQFKQFLQRGFPSRKEEAFKYTEIKNTALPAQSGLARPWQHSEKTAGIKKITPVILTFINGHFSAVLSETASLSREITLCPLSQAHEERVKSYLTREVDATRFPFAKLNAALMTDGLFLEIPKHVKVTTPIYLLFINTQQNHYMTCPRNIIVAHESSQVTVIEEHVGETAQHYFTNVVTEIHARANAHVDYYKLQDEDFTAIHVANVRVEQQQDSCVKTYFLSHGAQLAREDLTIFQRAQGTESYLHGLYSLSQDQQHIDHHIHVDHFAAHGTSAMLYKGILAKKSRAVFNGKVYVHPTAQQINAHQANHNLLLSADAEINTKPELEIYADDVKCTHGATVGQLDNEALFYLRSRGLSAREAHNILTLAFAEEIYSKIDDNSIRHYMRKRMGSHDQF